MKHAEKLDIQLSVAELKAVVRRLEKLNNREIQKVINNIITEIHYLEKLLK